MDSPDRLERYRWLYAGLRRGWQHATARYESWVQSCLSPGARILDLGCGRGGIVERLSCVGHWFGGDPDLASLREHRLSALRRCQLKAERLPYASATFDLVTASWVLEHILQPEALFREVARVLRPGGAFIFLTPNVQHPIPRLSQALARQARLQHRWARWRSRRAVCDAFPVYYRANSLRDLQRLTVGAGLSLVQLELVDDPSYFVWARWAFVLAVILEGFLPALWRVHIVGWYTCANHKGSPNVGGR